MSKAILRVEEDETYSSYKMRTEYFDDGTLKETRFRYEDEGGVIIDENYYDTNGPFDWEGFGGDLTGVVGGYRAYETPIIMVSHRDSKEGPTVINYNEDGSVWREEWYNHGKRHRTDGPAVIEYNEDGSVWRETYYFNHKKHREDGPAVIYYQKNGTQGKHYYFKGHNMNTAKRLEEVVKKETTKN